MALNSPGIGDIVLFCIDEELQRWRPLLVVAVDGEKISGELFLDWEQDRRLAWPTKLFYLLEKESRTQWVKGVERGLTLGTWRSEPGSRWVPKEKLPEKAPEKPPERAPVDPMAPRLALPRSTSQHLPLSRVNRGPKN